MTQIKPNRRVKKTINKTYRQHQTDIWGALSRVPQDKPITKFVSEANKAQLISHLRRYPLKISRKIRQKLLWGNKKPTRNIFLYQLSQAPQTRKPIKKTLQATLKYMRKKLLFFYFAGRIRAKTFRKFASLYLQRSYINPHKKIGQNLFLSYINYENFTLFLEARLDVLFLRIRALPTMYCIRQALYHRKANVRGQTPLNHPGFLVKIYRKFSINKNYTKAFNISINEKNDKEKNKQINLKFSPKYLNFNSAVGIVFKLFEPLVTLINYPFEANISAFHYSGLKHLLKIKIKDNFDK